MASPHSPPNQTVNPIDQLAAQQAALVRQLQEVEAQLKAARQAEKPAAIAKIRELMATYDVSIRDIDPSIEQPRSSRAKHPVVTTDRLRHKAAAKYRDPVSGATWAGRGAQPRWLRAALANGQQLEDFAL